MMYPKIETLYERYPDTHKVIKGQLKRPEFGLVNSWLVTEKIDGTNIRVQYLNAQIPTVSFKGRTDNAQMPSFGRPHRDSAKL